MVMKALASVEELSITTTLPAIKDVMEFDHGIYLPKLQVFQVQATCTMFVGNRHIENAVTAFSRFLEARGKGLPIAKLDIVPLEKFVLQLALEGKYFDEVLEVMHGWPSLAQVYINGSALERRTPSH